MGLWEKFAKTGSIYDYLKYKASSEGRSDDNAQGTDNKGRTERGEQ